MKVAYRERKACILRYGKRIDAEIIFQPRHQDGESKRVETRLVKRQIIRKRRQGDLLLGGDLLDRCNNL